MNIPLFFYGANVGIATLDNNIFLPESVVWRPKIPGSIRSRGYTPDVLVAMLREDPIALSKCNPIYTINSYGTTYDLLLSRVGLRPALADLLTDLTNYPSASPRRSSIIIQIVSLAKSVGRVVHVNGNRCDCRSSNLREIVEAMPTDDPSNEGL